MTQRFLTQSPFHRKIPNQLLVATDCSHKSVLSLARPREISRSDAIACMGARPAPRRNCSREQIQNTSFTSAKPRSSNSCHPKMPRDGSVPKALKLWVLLLLQVQH